ncbi:hypothetical protein NIES2101_43580 [Calothrix sp. HK-06]|nr:hypothetical protein NIES2101_43580 [Calothrix sp. HK-06]
MKISKDNNNYWLVVLLILIDSPIFKEDSVREELITPLLHALGYKASGEFQILRSKSLVHPFVNIGVNKRKITITPDYLLRVKN